MMLPLAQTDADPSPYGGISVFASDALLYANPFDSEDLPKDWLNAESIQSRIRALRAEPRVNYSGVRALKRQLFTAAFQQFKALPKSSPRVQAFRSFLEAESDWVENYALFHALLDHHSGKPWWDWENAYRTRDPQALAAFKSEQADTILFYQYLQWQFAEQARAVRDVAHNKNVYRVGDLPIYPNRNSAEVWEYQNTLFDVAASAGAPPDVFSKEGQNWDLPPYRWLENESGVVEFWLKRVRHAARLFDGMRIDHLLGFCGEWNVPRGEKGVNGWFVPSEEEPEKMAALGERVIRQMAHEAEKQGLLLIGEDLGERPDAVRQMLDRLSDELPNLLLYNVLGWRKAQEATHTNMLFVEAIHDSPATFADRLGDLSEGDLRQVADFFLMHGFKRTAHVLNAILDIEPVKRALRAATRELIPFNEQDEAFLENWKYSRLTDAERTEAVDSVLLFLDVWKYDTLDQLAERIAQDVILAALASKNRMRAFTLQSLFGWRGPQQRINTPNTVSNRNWTARMPQPIESLERRTLPEALHNTGFGLLAPLFYLRGEKDLGIGDLSLLPQLIDLLTLSESSPTPTPPATSDDGRNGKAQTHLVWVFALLGYEVSPLLGLLFTGLAVGIWGILYLQPQWYLRLSKITPLRLDRVFSKPSVVSKKFLLIRQAA